jgi:hypothetical protein
VEEDLSLSAARVLRAPAGDGAILAAPPLAEVGDLLLANPRRLDCCQSLADLRRQARAEALAAARNYLNQAGEPLPDFGPGAAESFLLAGHQPDLFHPGVWAKNFALHGLARAHGRTPLNLLVDNDTLKSTGLRVPEAPGPGGLPHLRTVLFDRMAGEIPYEERAVADPGLFASFADRTERLMRGWGFEPMLPDFWSEVRRQQERTPRIGECFASARRAFERAWGCHNLELPLSELCRTASFHRFAAGLLADLPRFHTLYNAAVHDYRRRNGIRSSNHPVPDLAKKEGWLEAPFWGWRTGQTRRGRLFARLSPERIELRADAETWPSLPSTGLAAAWGDLEGRGFKVRSRALTTTLFARLFLADLFIHGIGGGKYDELTDALIRGFYGLEPPAFLVLSATLWLPVAHEPAGKLLARHRVLARRRRDLYWNPQRHLDGALAAEKAAWIARPADTPPERRTRFETLRRLTAALRPALQGQRAELAAELAGVDSALAAATLLERRDYAFCLYPAATLRTFMTQFLHL